MEKIIHKLINDFTQGVDTYTHNDSTWLIFTDTKQWVIELTKTKTLWYNYNFFKTIFSYTSLDVVENQSYITKWVEDNIITKVKHTEDMVTNIFVDDTLENGVKETNRVDVAKKFFNNKMDGTIENGVKITTSLQSREYTGDIDDTLENGVRHTDWGPEMNDLFVDDALQNGVKETFPNSETGTSDDVEDTIQNGVKYTKMAYMKTNWAIDDTIENGVRDTQSNPYENESWINGVIKNGVKKTLWISTERESLVETTINNGVKETLCGSYLNVDNVIQDGVKKTSHRQFLKTYDVKDTIQDGTEHDRWILDGCNDPVDEVLDNGVKKTLSAVDNAFTFREVEDTIQNGVNETKSARGKYFEEVHDVLENGVKHTFNTEYMPKTMVEDIIQNGVKETKTPGKDGDILSTIEWMEENKSTSYTKMINDVIDNGEKINGTYDGGQRQSEKSKSVVEYGTKNKNP